MNSKTSITDQTPHSRSHSMDNLRTFTIILVIFFHGALAYSIDPAWWMVKELPGNFAFDMFMVICDIFMMPVCFFIAGYFALPSLDKYGAGKFFVGKLKRLGLPMIAGILVINPLTHFITVNHRHLHGSNYVSFKAAWIEFLNYMIQADTGVVSNFYLFSHRHFWFILLLLYFFIIFSVYASVYPVKQKEKQIGETKKTVFYIVALGAVISTIAFYLTTLYTHPDNWAMAGPFFMIQPSRLCLFGVMFILGIRAWKYQWFHDNTIYGSLKFWSVVNIIIFIITLVSMQLFYVNSSDSVISLMFHGLSRTVFTFTTLWGLLLFFNRKRCDTGTIRTSLARASFHMYIVHFPLVLLLQKLLIPLTVPFLIKFLTVGIATALISWLLSRYIIQKGYPVTIGAVTLFFSAMYFYF